ncbi:MAG: class I SAM-dependent methyltransferase [Bryobacterales bacterium]
MRILDAGCGTGRNLVYFLREGYEVFAADADSGPLEHVRSMAKKLAPNLWSSFRVESVESMSFEDECADVTICTTRYCTSPKTTRSSSACCASCGGRSSPEGCSSRGSARRSGWKGWSAAKPPPLVARTAPERYLVDAALLEEWTERLEAAKLADPLKTTIVQDLRAMTTWVMWKS